MFHLRRYIGGGSTSLCSNSREISGSHERLLTLILIGDRTKD